MRYDTEEDILHTLLRRVLATSDKPWDAMNHPAFRAVLPRSTYRLLRPQKHSFLVFAPVFTHTYPVSLKSPLPRIPSYDTARAMCANITAHLLLLCIARSYEYSVHGLVRYLPCSRRAWSSSSPVPFRHPPHHAIPASCGSPCCIWCISKQYNPPARTQFPTRRTNHCPGTHPIIPPEKPLAFV